MATCCVYLTKWRKQRKPKSSDTQQQQKVSFARSFLVVVVPVEPLHAVPSLLFQVNSLIIFVSDNVTLVIRYNAMRPERMMCDHGIGMTWAAVELLRRKFIFSSFLECTLIANMLLLLLLNEFLLKFQIRENLVLFKRSALCWMALRLCEWKRQCMRLVSESIDFIWNRRTALRDNSSVWIVSVMPR